MSKYHIRKYFEGSKPIPLCSHDKLEDIMVITTENYFVIYKKISNICCEVCHNTFKTGSPVRYAELMKQTLSKTFNER